MFKILESSSVERAIVSSPSSPEKKPVSSFDVSGIISSSIAFSSEINPLSPCGAGAFLISSRFVLRVLISSFKLERSATICWSNEESAGAAVTPEASNGSAEISSSSSAEADSLISLTTGAAFMLALPTERS